jgi:hypothetical protein
MVDKLKLVIDAVLKVISVDRIDEPIMKEQPSESDEDY